MKPRVIILSGYGLNCEEESANAFGLAGATSHIVHVNDLIDGKFKFKDYQIMVIPGGFSYGDDTGSGNAYALKMKNHLWEQVMNFVRQDRLVIGICNGFQVIANLGLLPATGKSYGEREIALAHNDLPRYSDRWVDLKIESDSPWLKGIKEISLPIAHGEGKLMTTPKTLEAMKKKNLIAARYFKGEICQYQSLPVNPNGSTDNIAAVTDETKKILGIMPHPERAIFFTQLPNWQLLKEKFKREGKPLPTYGKSLQIFRNAVNYFQT